MKLEVKFLISLALIVQFCTHETLGWRSFKIIFTSFSSQFNAEILDFKAQIQNSTGESTLDIVINFNQDIDDVNLQYAIALESNDSNYTVLVNRTVNFCKFMLQRSQEPILRLLYEDIIKQGHFIKACPIKKGAYSLHEYRIDEEMLPSYLPETSFTLDLGLRLPNGIMLFNGRLNGKIDKSKGFNNLKMFSLG